MRFIILLSSFYFLISIVFAQSPGDLIRGKLGVDAPPITGLQSIADPASRTGILPVLVNWMIGIFWIVTVAFLIWAAFTFLTANGEESKITEARKRIQYAVIAGIVATLATGIDVIVYYFLSGNTY